MYDGKMNPEIIHMQEYSHGDDAIHCDAIDFSANINPLGPPRCVIEYMRNLDRSDFIRYPDTNADELRETLSAVYSVSPETIIAGNGSMELLRLFCQVFLRRGDKALVPIPTFSEYERMIILHGGKCVFIQMEGFRMDASAILDKIDDKTKILFICNPNNPTARYCNILSEILQETAKKKIFVLLDEAFIDFSDYLSSVSEINPYLFVLKSATKIFSIPSLRCGYGISDPSIIGYMKKAATPWNINHFAQEAVRRALHDRQFIDFTRQFLKREKSYMKAELQKISHLQVFPSDTNFFLIRTGAYTSPNLKAMLLEKGILIRDCSNFRGLDDHFFRVCVRIHEENEILIEELKSLHVG